jgi:hypothetical protein
MKKGKNDERMTYDDVILPSWARAREKKSENKKTAKNVIPDRPSFFP